MKRDWESYFNKPNKYGVIPYDWENKNENHTRYSNVICFCPVCKKEYCKAHDIPLYEIRFNEDVETKVNEILTELNLIKEAI